MGGRANPLQDAAATVGIGQTELAKQINRPAGQPASADAVDASGVIPTMGAGAAR
jgi:hypothetical protein